VTPDVPRIKKIKDLISQLPDPNYVLLKYLIQFLHRVSTHAKVNLMHSGNLAIVFGPNLIR
jgi:hypothetical protein